MGEAKGLRKKGRRRRKIVRNNSMEEKKKKKKTSGAIQQGEPVKVSALELMEEAPKSQSLISPFALIRMLVPLMSL